jgi:hypothetical protein
LAVSELRIQDRLLRVVEPTASLSAWVTAVVDRHTASLTPPEFLKAVRALSARYVERRSELGRRNPTDSPGKRAAFAGFFAPLHFFTVAAIASALELITSRARTEIVDLGCGTGVCAAAMAQGRDAVTVVGVDEQRWALDEARWNWRQLDVKGRALQKDLVTAAEELARPERRSASPAARLAVLGWSANELEASARARLLEALVAWRDSGHGVLVIEPIARHAAPWWPEWVAALDSPTTRDDEWTLPVELPERLRALDEAAGFDREALKARSLFAPGRS